MKGQHEVKVRAIDERGSFQINTRVEAGNPIEAIQIACARFSIPSSALIFVHAEPTKGDDK